MKNTEPKWRVEYTDGRGTGAESWDVTNGARFFECFDADDANWLCSTLNARDESADLAKAMQAERDKMRENLKIAVENHYKAIARAESCERQLNELEDQVINGDDE